MKKMETLSKSVLTQNEIYVHNSFRSLTLHTGLNWARSFPVHPVSHFFISFSFELSNSLHWRTRVLFALNFLRELLKLITFLSSLISVKAEILSFVLTWSTDENNHWNGNVFQAVSVLLLSYWNHVGVLYVLPSVLSFVLKFDLWSMRFNYPPVMCNRNQICRRVFSDINKQTEN
jgi:hypothetical protein